MGFDYVARFTLLLNDFNDSVKRPPGKYPLEDILQKSSRVYPSYSQSDDAISL